MLFESEKSKFETLVKAYSPELYRYAYWRCRDRFVAEDLVQETFTRAWQAWEKLRDEKAAKSWLYTILRNEHARLYEGKRIEVDEAQELDEIVDTSNPGAYESFEMSDMLKALPPGYREPLVLQVLGGFSCAEIASMMNISEGAVMTRLTRARLALRKMPGPVTARRMKAR
ncbi:MAG: RNA polymerase subunit sigma [Betaproteobacteria bacterium RIFCSPLOWO2_12_FULL_62_13]|nr:MAG: RNA polymerase subunit sigma [Betaproteobacteria bacterium RIFCSPLOWO2_12_FULL_62_13]